MRNNLRKELLQQGAGKNEAKNLASLAAQLPAAKPRGLSAAAKQRMYDRLPVSAPKERRPITRWALAGSLAGAMALLALITLPNVLRHPAAPSGDSGAKALVQPVETQLQHLDTQIEQLQQQPDVDQAQLQQTEDTYKRTLNNFKKRYQNNKKFQNYDWNKWQRSFTTQSYQKDTNDSRANGTSTNQTDQHVPYRH